MMQIFIYGLHHCFFLGHFWIAFSKRNCGLPVCFFIIVNLGSKNGNSKSVLVQRRVVMNLNGRTFIGTFFGSSSAFQRWPTFLRDLVKNLSIRTWFFCSCFCHWFCFYSCRCLCRRTRSARFSSTFQRGATFLSQFIQNLSIRTWVNHCILYICITIYNVFMFLHGLGVIKTRQTWNAWHQCRAPCTSS